MLRNLRSRLGVVGLSAAVLLQLGGMAAPVAGQRAKVDRRTVTPNKPTPELYSDRLSLKVTLMNLPGAATPGSSWQGEYKVFFVAEREFDGVMKQLSREGRARDLRQEYFPGRILLAQGQFNKARLGTLRDRTSWRNGIPFRGRVPAAQQTSFASIIIFYSVKVYDAKLRKNVYDTGHFVVPPFDTNSSDRDNFTAATTLYMSFYVSERGDIYKTNRKGASESTEWRPS